MIGLLLQAALLIVKSVAEFLTVLLLVRFFMQLFRVSFANQLGAFVLQLSNWLVLPLRRLLPGVFGLDLASLLPAFLLQLIVVGAVIALRGGFDVLAPQELAWLIVARGLLGLLRTCLYLFIGLLIVQAVLSWVNPLSPLSRPISQMTDFFLRPIRRLVPPVAHIDLSPLIAILMAQVILVFI